VLPAVLAVGAIAAVVLLLIGIFGRTTDPGGAAAPISSPSRTALPTISASSPPPTTAPTTTSAPTTSAAPAIPDITVLVLNSTDTSRLAARVTEYLAGLGWQVTEPDNFYPPLDETTVYYPEGQEAAARQLAATVPGAADLVLPVIPSVAQDGLTVVLGNDANDWVAPGATSAPPTTTT
jgi:hypothetical protein